MDFDDLMKKIGVKMNEARDMLMDLTDKAGKKAGEIYGDAKIRLKLADIQRDVNSLYKEIGSAAYTANRAGEDVNAVIGEKCDEIQRLYGEMEEIAKGLAKAQGKEVPSEDDDIFETEAVESEEADKAADVEEAETGQPEQE